MSKYKAKSALRSAKNFTLGYSETQIKVRAATSNDPWGPSGQEMAELARATFKDSQFYELMDMLDKRLNDHGKNWRHVFKSLIVLEYCLVMGSENVVRYAKENMHVIKTLKEFMHVDEQGKDQGVNVRQKSKEIVALLADEVKLREMRSNRTVMADKFGGEEGQGSTSGRNRSRSSVSRGAEEEDDTEQRELELAIELSKRTAEEHSRKLKENEKEFQVALTRSLSEFRDAPPARKEENLIDIFSDDNRAMITSKSDMTLERRQNPFASDPFNSMADPNLIMGEIARNSQSIDPFAELASNRIATQPPPSYQNIQPMQAQAVPISSSYNPFMYSSNNSMNNSLSTPNVYQSSLPPPIVNLGNIFDNSQAKKFESAKVEPQLSLNQLAATSSRPTSQTINPFSTNPQYQAPPSQNNVNFPAAMNTLQPGQYPPRNPSNPFL